MKEDKILKYMGEIIERELQEDNNCDYSNVSISPDTYHKIKNAAMELDRKHIEKRKKIKSKRLMQMAACFIGVFTIITVAVPDAATAMKALLFNVTVDEEGGGISLVTGADENDMNEWDSYYYPEYLPEGFELKLVDDEDSYEMVFLDPNSDVTITIDQCAFNTSLIHDTETADMERRRINGWDGYIFVDEDNCYVDLILYTDLNITCILVRESTDKNIAINIAENLRLTKNE